MEIWHLLISMLGTGCFLCDNFSSSWSLEICHRCILWRIQFLLGTETRAHFQPRELEWLQLDRNLSSCSSIGSELKFCNVKSTSDQ
jgi:hypothetical protein